MIIAVRLQGVAARGRGRAVPAPGGPRGGRHRRARRVPRRDGEGVRQPAPRRGGHRARADRVLQGAHGGLQVPARRSSWSTSCPKTVTGKILRRELRSDAWHWPDGVTRRGSTVSRSWSPHSVSLRSAGFSTLPPALRGSGSARNEMNCGTLKSAILLLREGTDLGRVGVGAGARHDDRAHLLAHHRVGNPEHRDLEHVGVLDRARSRPRRSTRSRRRGSPCPSCGRRSARSPRRRPGRGRRCAASRRRTSRRSARACSSSRPPRSDRG